MCLAGAMLFARYAYPPDEPGLGGPSGLRAVPDRETAGEIERRARLFEGAWTYLELLADALGTDDPLDVTVVESYWIGGELLERVPPAAVVAQLEGRLGEAVGTWRGATARARAHHSFEVFEVLPWARMLHESKLSRALTELDRCRIRVGKVLDVDRGMLAAHTGLLGWDGTAVEENDTAIELLRWSPDGSARMPRPAPGDLVAVHADWVCDVLTDEQAERIGTLEREQRDSLARALFSSEPRSA